MILQLTILNGTHAGHAVQVTAGTPRTFGRAAQADVVLQDVYLSDVHFALYCDEQGARVRDLQSHNGTFLNNTAVADATLAAGDRISAGQTVFEVALTDHALDAPTNAVTTTGEITAEDLVRGMQSAPHDCARWALHSEEGNYFAVIDCARDPDLLALVNRVDEEFCAFDETREPDDLGETAPFLLSLTPATHGLADVFEETWGRGHAIFLVSPRPFIEVYQHLISLVTWDEQGKLGSARFWEPLKLGEHLARMAPEETAEFFGPLACILAETADARVMARYARTPEGAVTATKVAMSLQGV
ncbi:MAG: hypothetical protein JWM10_5390 [Myxococcaceae bacterium]|nr:hypothetical protein [Myxococcaceae bacterium]